MATIKIFDDSLEKFIVSLEKQTIAKVLRTIDLLETFGHRLNLPYAKKVSSNLFELRIRGAQEIRIFYCFHKENIILLHGFIKKFPKIPQKELHAGLRKLKRVDTA